MTEVEKSGVRERERDGEREERRREREKGNGRVKKEVVEVGWNLERR